MEDMMTLMMTTTTMGIHENNTTTSFSPLPSWKLYDNPFYYFSSQQNPHGHHDDHNNLLNLPATNTSLSSSSSLLCHLTLFQPMFSTSSSSIQSDLDLALAQIEELKAEVEFERRMRKKAESTNKRLAKEVAEERKRHEASARLCEDLAEEVASKKAAVDGMKREMEEERKMMRIAEVWREERVQMKLEEARILLGGGGLNQDRDQFVEEEEDKALMKEKKKKKKKRGEEEEDMMGISDLMMGTIGNISIKVQSTSQRKGSPEAENPHIRRGIKGFVEEFPRVVRAVGSRGRQQIMTGSNLECQRAQLRLLLRHKNPAGLGVAGPDNLNLVV